MSNLSETSTSQEVDLYRESECRFRDIHDWESLTESGLEIADVHRSSRHFVGCRNAGVFAFRAVPDAYLLPAALDDWQQVGLAYEALSEFIEPPNKTNLSAHGEVPAPLWSHGHEFRKLRWATLGWQYDWGSRSYTAVSAMPDSVSRLSAAVLRAAGIAEVPMTAAIVNFYHGHRISDRLGGHVDDVDGDSSPLVSVSLGLPCIFLHESIQGTSACTFTFRILKLILVLRRVSRTASSICGDSGSLKPTGT
uniref:Alpha-ketoglutarate-dependent dioxygenase AlkB-like domain-containing protein n=1 Tax=Oxyrrhis marina TaxID=2969 RepID=A0A7S3XJF6_OXYMA